MLHLKGSSGDEIMERMIRETEIYYRNGVDAVLVENYFNGTEACVRALEYLYENMPEKKYGVNILGDHSMAFELAAQYEADFIQIDSVCGHLTPKKDAAYAEELECLMQYRSFQVLGGLRFKYNPVRSGRTFEQDAELAMQRCDAVVTTGAATGEECQTEKLAEFRAALKEFPLIVGAGVTADNVCEKLQYADGVIIGSWLKWGHCDHGDVYEEYVIELMDRVREFRRTSKQQKTN